MLAAAESLHHGRYRPSVFFTTAVVRDPVGGPALTDRLADLLQGSHASSEVRGSSAVADTFSMRARFAQPAVVNGAAGAVSAAGGQPRVLFDFTIEHERIVEIHLIADPRHLGQLDLTVLDY